MNLTQKQLEQIEGGLGRSFEETDDFHEEVVKNAQRAVKNGAAIFGWDANALIGLVAYGLDRLVPARVAAFAVATDVEILDHIMHHGGPLSAIVHALAIEDQPTMDAVLSRVRGLVDTLERAGVVIGEAPHFYLDSSKLQPRVLPMPTPGIPVARGSSTGIVHPLHGHPNFHPVAPPAMAGGELIGPIKPISNDLPADIAFADLHREVSKKIEAAQLDVVAERMKRIADMTKMLMDAGVPPSLAFPEVVRQVDLAIGTVEPVGPALVRQAGQGKPKGPSMAEQLLPPGIQFGAPLNGPQVSPIASAFGATIMVPQNGLGTRAGVQGYPSPAAAVQVNGHDFDGYAADPFDPNFPH